MAAGMVTVSIDEATAIALLKETIKRKAAK